MAVIVSYIYLHYFVCKTVLYAQEAKNVNRYYGVYIYLGSNTESSIEQ